MATFIKKTSWRAVVQKGDGTSTKKTFEEEGKAEGAAKAKAEAWAKTVEGGTTWKVTKWKERWQAFIRRGGKTKKATFSLKARAEEWARRLEGSREEMRALGTKSTTMTLADLARDFQAAGLGRPSRVQFWVERFGMRSLDDIAAEDIRDALNDYTKGKAQVFVGHGKTRPLDRKRGPASRNRLRDQLASMYAWAIEERGYPKNPVHDVSRVKEPKGRDRHLSDEETTRLLAAARGFVTAAQRARAEKERQRVERLAARGITDPEPLPPLWEKLPLLVMMALATGARASELTGKVRWERINWRDRTVQIDDTKNTDSRVLVLPQPVVLELMKHRQKTGLVFGRVGDAEKPFTVKKHWDAAVKAAGIENFRFHDCRHTAASNLVNQGVDLHTVGKTLGHRSLQSTARYAHLDIDAVKAAVDRVMTSERLGGGTDSK